jgi:hypothetical protein
MQSRNSLRKSKTLTNHNDALNKENADLKKKRTKEVECIELALYQVLDRSRAGVACGAGENVVPQNTSLYRGKIAELDTKVTNSKKTNQIEMELRKEVADLNEENNERIEKEKVYVAKIDTLSHKLLTKEIALVEKGREIVTLNEEVTILKQSEINFNEEKEQLVVTLVEKGREIDTLNEEVTILKQSEINFNEEKEQLVVTLVEKGREIVTLNEEVTILKQSEINFNEEKEKLVVTLDEQYGERIDTLKKENEQLFALEKEVFDLKEEKKKRIEKEKVNEQLVEQIVKDGATIVALRKVVFDLEEEKKKRIEQESKVDDEKIDTLNQDVTNLQNDLVEKEKEVTILKQSEIDLKKQLVEQTLMDGSNTTGTTMKTPEEELFDQLITWPEPLQNKLWNDLYRNQTDARSKEIADLLKKEKKSLEEFTDWDKKKQRQEWYIIHDRNEALKMLAANLEKKKKSE